MTRLYGSLLLLLFMLVTVACTNIASSEQLAQESPAATRATLLAQQEEPSATRTTAATLSWGTPLVRALDSTTTPAISATATTTPAFIPSPPDPTPVSLTTEAIAECPVTQPPEPPFDPPGKPVPALAPEFEGRFWYGSDALYISLPRDGTWAQLVRGDKVFWWSENYPGGHEEPQPAMTIRAWLVQAPGETFEQSGATNASHANFPATAMLHGLTVPARGCWEIIGEYKEEALSFVVWVP